MAMRWLAALALGLMLAAPALAEQQWKLHVISGFFGPRQFRTVEQPFWLQEVPRLTEGRVTVELRVGNGLGIAAEQMLTVMRNGAVTIGTLEVSGLALAEPELGVADLPLLAEDSASLRRAVDLWRPRLAALLRGRYGIELLAVFVRPPQVMFCNRPFSSLLDLAGRRIRIASVNQSDVILALGAHPVVLALERSIAGFEAGALDCAVTGALPASVVGLTRVTSHVSPVPLGWSMAFLTANGAAWAMLPDSLRTPLGQGIGRLEDAMWQASETQRAEGEACLASRPGCPAEPSHLQPVVESEAGAAAIRGLFASAVLPGWVHRCGAACAESWNAVAGPTSGLTIQR